MKRNTKRPSTEQVKKIKEKLDKYVEFINSHEIYLHDVPAYKEAINQSLISRGYSLIKVTNLAEVMKVEEFCNSNNLEYIDY